MYEIAPEHFVAARDGLVKRLRAAGDKAAASTVAKRRRPPLTAWALNRAASADPGIIDELLTAGGELRAAMAQALDGDASGLRRAHSQDRAAVEAVVAGAAVRLFEGGYTVTDVMRNRMAATLRAATIDESVARRLRAGRLDGDEDAPGFGIDALVPAAPRTPEVVPVGDLAAGRERRRQQELDRLAEVADRLEVEAQALVEEASRLEGEAERLEAVAAAAREQALETRRSAAAAVEAAATARSAADRAAAAAE